MSDKALTRRTFLAGTAGVAAVCAVTGTAGLGPACSQAFAQATPSETRTAYSFCNACSSKCGFKAYVVDGKLDKMIGDHNHPHAEGKLCACGYGYSQIEYSKDRLTKPLKKSGKNTFVEISWEQAYAEIAEKLDQIIKSNGPSALAAVQDPRPSGKYYTERFMNALGCANVYTNDAASCLSRESGFAQVIGASNYSSDVENSKMTMYLGRSAADAARPSSVAEIQKARENGSHIVLVDPRCNNTRQLADEWVPINPGTDLALVLAMSNVLVKRGLYDDSYVDSNSVGFSQWAASLASCTPEWAENITGIDAPTIERLALEFAAAAPAASIEPGSRGAFGCSYANSGETARAVCLFNTLLGCWNKKGGALLIPNISAGTIDDKKFPEVPKPADKQLGSEEYPLALASMGSNLYAAKMADEGKIKGMFFYNSNMVAEYSNPEYLAQAMGKLDLMVVIDVQMSDTARLADYVLPECAYLERLELPDFIDGKIPAVSLSDQVLDRTAGTKSVDEIFRELAQACGIGQYFDFTVEELADAQLKTVGSSLEDLRRVGTISFPEKEFSYGKTPDWNTPTGKIQFVSEACAKAGISPYPIWVEPAVMPDIEKGELRLISGKQAHMSNTRTTNCKPLMQITKDYDLTRVWINASVAKKLGIEDGDTVVVSNENHEGKTRVKVTERLNPTALFMPDHYGVNSPEQHEANGIGLRVTDFVPFNIEPGYGSAMSQEAVVKIKKVGA